MSLSLEERRAERRRQRQLKEDFTNGAKSPDELHADVQERLARRRKERLEKLSALASGGITVNGEDDLERRRRERREARLRASEDTSDDYNSRRNRRRGTDEDITNTTEDDYSSYRTRRRRNWDDDETPTVNETPSVPDTSEEDAAAERRRRQREEEEEEARRQQEREEEEQRKQEELRRQREAEEQERRRREEARREEEERQRRISSEQTEPYDPEGNTEDEEEEDSNLQPEVNQLFIDEDQLLNRDTVKQEDKLDRVKQWNNENNVLNVQDVSDDGISAKTNNSGNLQFTSSDENSSNKVQSRNYLIERSPSFREREINNNKIRDKLAKFEQLSESRSEKVVKDRTVVPVSEKSEGLKGRLAQFEKEIKDQEKAAKEKKAVASSRHEPAVFSAPAQKVSAKLQQFEIAAKSQSTTKASSRNVQSELEQIGSSKNQRQALLGRWSQSETQINTVDLSPAPKRNIIDRWKPAEESPKSSVKSSSDNQVGLNKRLSGNTEFVAARYLEKASKSIEEPVSPRIALSNKKSPTVLTRDKHVNIQPEKSPVRSRFSDAFENQSEKLDNQIQSKSHDTEKQPIREPEPTVLHSRGSSYDDPFEHSRGSSFDASSERSGRYSQYEQEEEERLEQERLEQERLEEESRMAEEQKKKRGKKKGLGGLTPEKKKLLKDVVVEYTTDEEEEKMHVIAERMEPLPDDFDFLSTAELKKLCKKLHQTLAQIHSEVYDWEFKVGKQQQEVTELTNKVNDSKGKFVKPVLRKVNKTEQKFAKLSKKSDAKEDFRETLKSVPDEDELEAE